MYPLLKKSAAMSFYCRIRAISFIFFWMITALTFGQVTYKITLDADKVTYRVLMKSALAYSGSQARIGSAQVTIVVPHSNTNKFLVGDVKGKSVTNTNTGITSEMLWSSTRVDSPSENPGFAYISFGFNNSASPILFDIAANQEVEILSFKNVGACVGAASLFENASDPFKSPNSANSNPGNSMSIAGFGFGNVYQGNYGGAVNCQATAPDLRVTPSGASTITVGSNYSLTLTAANIGNAASSGTYQIQTTLPSGVSYISNGGSGWVCSSTNQPGGTTLVTCQNSGILNASASSVVTLTLSAANTLANNSIVTISGNISGGGDSNASNNNYLWGPTVINNTIPDLSATMTGQSNIMAGTQTSYSINLSNIGTAPTSGQYSVSLTLPTGISYNSFSGSGWNLTSTIQGNGSTLINATSSATVNAGGSAVPLVLNVTPSASLVGGSSVLYSGFIVGGGDTSPNNNNFSFTSNISAAPKPVFNLSITGNSTVTAGNQTNIIYNITNIGNASTSGAYNLIITLPAGITYNSFTGTGWAVASASQVNGSIILTAQSNTIIAAGGAVPPLTINVTPSASFPNNTLLSINNSLSGGGTTGIINSTFNLTVTRPQLPNIGISISGASTVISGNATTYTFTLSNTGNVATSGVYTITTTLPAGVSYNSFTGAGWTVNASPQANGTTIIIAQSSTVINAGGNGTPLILNVTPTANQSTIVVINSVVLGGGASGSNSANQSITISPNLVPDLTVSVSGQNPLTIGGNSTLTYNINNIGSGSTNGQYSFTTTLPAGISYSSFSGTGWSVTATPQANGTTIITAQNSTIINAGGSATPLILNIGVANTLSNNSTLILNTTVFGGGDTNTSNNSSIYTVIATISNSNADLTTVIIGPSMVTPNTPINYTINVSNIGVGATSGTYFLNTTIPAGMTFNSYSGGSMWTCQNTAQSNGTTLVSCQSLTPLSANANATPIILNLTPVNNLAGGSTLTVYALVSGGGDNSSSNNSFTFTSTVSTNNNTNRPDLKVIILGPTNVASGIATNYSLNVQNVGNATSYGLYTLTTTLPAGMTFNSFSGGNWFCGTTPQANNTTQVFCQTSVPIGVGGNASFLTFNLTANGNSQNSFTINTVVNGGGETNQSNNTSSLTLTTSSSGNPSLNVNISGANIVTPGVATNYTINVSNNGTSSTSGIYYVTTYIPEGFTYNSSSGNGWSCSSVNQSNGTTKLICQSSNPIAIGGSGVPIIVNLTPKISNPNNTLLIINSDVVGGGSINTTTNFFNFYAQVLSSIDLELGLSISNKTPTIGQPITYTVVLTNKGPAAAANVSVLVNLPPALSGITFGQVFNGNSQPANFNPSTGYWSVASLGVNQSITLTITGTVNQKGVFFATAEIMQANMPDTDSVVGNGNELEDDFGRVCFTVPITICAGESYQVNIPSTYTNVQWLRNGTPIQGATSNSYTITQAGNYSFTSNVSCPVGGCCDIIVQQGTTPTMSITQPSVVCSSINLATVPIRINNVQVQVGLTYYSSQANAQSGLNQLTNTTVSTTGTYWVRYQAFGECSVVGSINVNISGPALTVPTTFNTCSGSLLSSIPVSVNGSAITVGLTYYTNQSNAQLAINPLTNLAITSAGTYWIRYQTTDGCFNIASVNVTLNATKPTIPNVADQSPQCPITAVNLVALQPSSPSTTGGTFEWHTANSPSSPLVTNASSVGAGTYYIFEKSTNQCYSDGDAVKVVILDCCKPTICVPFTISRN
ncbi:MAG: beta strand repeat-containing protein [Spirosomataceae bacterium]